MENETNHPLTRWRTERDIKAAELGRKIGCTRQSVSRYESGRTPDQPYLDRIVILTEGEVDANAWLGEEAADVVARRNAQA